MHTILDHLAKRADEYPQTAASIEAAKRAQAVEREIVFQQTGIRIEDEPIRAEVVPHPTSLFNALVSVSGAKPYLIHCPRPGCRFVGSARTDGGAVRSIAAHLVGAHMRREK